MFPALDVGRAVGAFTIADGDIRDLEVEFRGTEEEVEVPEGIEVAEVGAVGGDGFVVRAAQDFGSAEGVFHGLTEEPGEDEAKGFVGAEIEKLHRLFVHRVDEAHAVGEFGAAARDHVVEFGEILGWHREIGVEDHQDIARRDRETGAHGVALALAGLLEDFDLTLRICGGDFLDLRPRIVARVAFDKDEFGAGPHVGGAGDGGGNVAGFIAGGDNDGDSQCAGGGRACGTGDDEDGQG